MNRKDLFWLKLDIIDEIYNVEMYIVVKLVIVDFNFFKDFCLGFN